MQLPSKKITVELKSLNSKNLDLNARVPSSYKEKELEMRGEISKSLVRGKVDFSLYVESTGEDTHTKLNEVVVKNYMQQLGKVVNADETELLKMAMRMPDTLKTEREEIDPSEFNEINQALEEALKAINIYREDEGKAMEKDFVKRSGLIADLLEKIIEIDAQRMDIARGRLRKAVSDLKEAVDENRFEQEMIYYLEKYACRGQNSARKSRV